jgi:Rrf2 family protein
MHLSSQEEYGVRCLIQVARHAGPEPITIPDIAAAEGLSPEYTAKLMRMLRQGDLVVSTRGAGGGYHLARPSDQITIWDAISVLGASFFPDSFCDTHPGNQRDCVHTTNCSIRVVWGALEGALRSVLENVTLADLTRGERSMQVRFDLPASGTDEALSQSLR